MTFHVAILDDHCYYESRNYKTKIHPYSFLVLDISFFFFLLKFLFFCMLFSLNVLMWASYEHYDCNQDLVTHDGRIFV